MKRLIVLLLAAVMLLTGCARQEAEARKISVTFTVDCDTPVHAVSFEYCLNRVPLGGMAVSRDQYGSTAIPGGSALWLSFEEHAFPDADAAEAELFGLMASVITADGVAHHVESLVEWQAAFGAEYAFTLTGSAETGFAFLPQEEGFILTPAEAYINP